MFSYWGLIFVDVVNRMLYFDDGLNFIVFCLVFVLVKRLLELFFEMYFCIIFL